MLLPPEQHASAQRGGFLRYMPRMHVMARLLQYGIPHVV
jgi:hypothetical protein